MQTKLKFLPLVLATALSLTACGGKKTEKIEPPKKQVESSVNDVQKEDIEIINVTAADLSDKYRSNEPMSDKEFKAKTAEIVGTIESIDELDNKTFVTLSGHEKDKSPLIHCFFAEDIDASELNVGDEITIIGKIAGKQEVRNERVNVVVEESVLK